ncbi:MAG: hypothetical protein ACK51V_02305 [bacterium]|jgi:hypothetical protein|nr:hypothetical protein [Betaproteobacteria bacterium]
MKTSKKSSKTRLKRAVERTPKTRANLSTGEWFAQGLQRIATNPEALAATEKKIS